MDFLNSIYDYVKSRLTNPFLGTFIVIWIFRNWLLVYSLFNFDENFGWKEKVEFIQHYLYSKDLGYELKWNIIYTFLALGATLLIMAITRFITNLYEFRLIPLTYKFTEHPNLETKERFNILKQLNADKDLEIQRLADESTKYQSLNRGLSGKILDLEKINLDEKIKVTELEVKISELKVVIQNNDEEIQAYRKKDIEKLPKKIDVVTIDNIQGSIKQYLENKPALLPEDYNIFQDIVQTLYSVNKITEFKEVFREVEADNEAHRYVISVEKLKYFENLGLLHFTGVFSELTDNKVPAYMVSATSTGNHIYNILQRSFGS